MKSFPARLLGPLGILAFAAILFFAPFGFRWPCPLKSLAGVPCPTCGMTRAARLAAHGDFAGATHMHPLWFVVLPLLGIAAAIEIARYMKSGVWGAAARIAALRYAAYATLMLLVGVWIARFFGAFGGPSP